MTLAKRIAFVKIPPLMRLRLGVSAAALLMLSPFSLGGIAPSARAEGILPARVNDPLPEPSEERGEDVFFASSGDSLASDARPPSWVMLGPSRATQTQKTSRERGVNPCMAPDPGFRTYSTWDRAPSMGQMIVPKQMKLGKRAEFDVFFHFHGHEPARKAWVQAMDSVVFVGIDLGVGSGAYLRKFQTQEEFQLLLASVERGVAAKLSIPEARVRRIGVSAWSAGYGAVSQLLRVSELANRIDSVVLLDGLHSGYSGNSLEAAKMAPFVDFAQQAARGKKLMFVSHSSIIPPGYASTTETASYLIWKTGGQPTEAKSRAGDPVGLSLVRRYTRGNFHVRGFAGNDTLDHCAHLALFKDVLRTHVVPRWDLR